MATAMAQQPFRNSISTYRLRKDRLEDYLKSQFPGYTKGYFNVHKTATIPATWNPLITGWTWTQYSTTTTTTSSIWILTHTAVPTTILCYPESTATATYNARCAPSNMISERENRGVTVRWLSNEQWSIPLNRPFDSDLFAEATNDPTVCCQVCVDNPGCAASEWKRSWNDGCRLYYFNTDSSINGTCGPELEYFGDVHEFPGQASFLQVGCGSLKYIGGMNPSCPSCAVEDE